MIACKDADNGHWKYKTLCCIHRKLKVVDARPGEEIFGMTMIVSKGKQFS